jgi:hypothetical protein
MTTFTTTERLEALKREIEAARNATLSYQGDFTDGMASGLRIALNAVDNHLQIARYIEAAMAVHQ